MEGENNFTKPPKEGEKKLYKAKVVCSSCGKDMGEKDGFEQEGITTHGSCEECNAKNKAEEKAKIMEFLKNNPPEKK